MPESRPSTCTMNVTNVGGQAETPLNYYNYFTEIEETFVRRRGKNLLLSPLDWAMIESWQDRGIPLHIVIRAIESVFDKFDQNPRPRSIKGLLYCKEEVEAQFSEWAKDQIGKHQQSNDAAAADPGHDAASHIAGLIDDLAERKEGPLADAFERAVVRLRELASSLSGDIETIDNSLLDIERFLDQALLTNSPREHLTMIEAQVAEQLEPYRGGMEPDAYRSTFSIMVLKRLREIEGLPRFGLYNL